MLFRPRLRSTTGCITCRRRRKKCDEKRPRCRDCSRHGLRCLWPGDSAASPASKTTVSSECHQAQPVTALTGPLRRSPLHRFLGARSNAEHDLFQHFVFEFMPLLFRSGAHPGYYARHDIYVTATTHPWMMAIYLGLSALHVSRGDASIQAIAENYYYKAVGAYWRRITAGDTDATEDWVLNAAIFLYLFEQWRSGVACNVMRHLEGAAQIIRLRKAKGNRDALDLTSRAQFDRIATESFAYHVATVSLFYDDVDSLSSKFSWADIDEALRSSPFPRASELANSPILGLSHGLSPTIYRLTFEVTRLSRHAPLQGRDLARGLQCRCELDALKALLLDDSAPDSSSFSSSSSSGSGSGIGGEPSAQLYVAALEIFLAKLLRPDTAPTDPPIRQLVQRCMALTRLGSLASGVPRHAFLCWPMVILACAIESAADIVLLKERLLELWGVSFCGHVRRAALVIERLWQWRSGHGSGEGGTDYGVMVTTTPEEGTMRNGLDLLVGKSGLCRILNMS